MPRKTKKTSDTETEQAPSGAEPAEQFNEAQEARIEEIIAQVKESLKGGAGESENQGITEAEIRSTAIDKLKDEEQKQLEAEQKERERAEKIARENAEYERLKQKPFDIKMNLEVFNQFIQASVSLVDEAVLEIRPEGLRLMAMDLASISMIHAEIPNQYCSKFQHNENRLGLNLENVDKILARNRRADAEIELTNSEESATKLKVNIITSNKVKSYTLQIIDIKKSVEKEPKMEYKAIIGMKSQELNDIIKEAGLFSSYLMLGLDQKGFVAMARGDAGKYENKLAKEHPSISKYNVIGSEAVEATYNMEFLENMVSPAVDKETVIELRLSKNEPISLSYEKTGCRMQFYLAPYMEE